MRKTLTVAPMTRVEGHLDISVTVDVKRTSKRMKKAPRGPTRSRRLDLEDGRAFRFSSLRNTFQGARRST